MIFLLFEIFFLDIYYFGNGDTYYQEIFTTLSKIGQKCKLLYEQHSFNIKNQYASMFILSTNEADNKINLQCLQKLESQLSNSNDNPERVNICRLTSSAIAALDNNRKCGVIFNPSGKVIIPRKNNNNNYDKKCMHTEEVLLSNWKSFELYVQQILEACVGEEPTKNTAYWSNQKFNLFLFSHLSPCDNCLKLIQNYHSDNKARVEKVMVSYVSLYTGTTESAVNGLNREIEIWIRPGVRKPPPTWVNNEDQN